MAVEVFEGIQSELNHVYEKMVQELESDQSYLNQIISYLLQKRGKMIRPALVILAGKVCGSTDEEKLYTLAAAVEILHMATLIHDDIVDEADVRRNLTTVNKMYGNQLAVLVGDFFYARALKLLSRVQHGFELVAGIVSNLVQGEFLQHANSFKIEQELDTYWQLINYKTAYFIANCCRLGAIESRANVREVEALTVYGERLGLAFQICDDLLDFSINSQRLGKSTFKDVSNGIYTLPVLHALQNSNVQNRLRSLLQKDILSFEDRTEIEKMLKQSGSLEFAHKEAFHLCEAARNALDIFPVSREKDLLISLTRFNLKREF